MHRFVAGGECVLLGMLVLAGVGLSGCCVSQPLPRETLAIQQPPEELPKAPLPVREAPPAPRPEPRPAAPVVEVKPPPPLVPPAIVAAIEDLGQKYPGLFVFDKERGQFRFNSDITFDSGSAVVKPEAAAALTKLAEILSNDQVKDRRLTVVGHTDNVPVKKPQTIAYLKRLGKAADNMGLSEARAESVAAVLKGGGIDAARMATRGMGETSPVADNRTAAGKAKNRRVEIFLTLAGSRATTSPPGRFPSAK